MSKRWLNRLPVSANANEQFHFVVHFIGPSRDVKRMTMRQNGAVWFQKKQRFGWNRIAQFLGVFSVIAPNANDLHSV
jgi:hypothetical protein